tara:strand:+ start:1298 stop:1711 length:414 start_codon:yes stop_codon:yes gene_type:complete
MLSVGCFVTTEGQLIVDNLKNYPENIVDKEGCIVFQIEKSLKCPYHQDSESWDAMECKVCLAYKEHVNTYLQISKNSIVFCVFDKINLKDNFTLLAYLDYKSALLNCLDIDKNQNVIIICTKFKKDLWKLHNVTWIK